MIKEQIRKDLKEAIEKSGVLQGNFLDEIEWILKNVKKGNFEDFVEAIPVGKLRPEVKKFLEVKDDFVYLKSRIYAKIKGWWKDFEGHPEVDNAIFYSLPYFLHFPLKILADKKGKKNVLLVGFIGHYFVVVLQKDVKNEIVTIFPIRERGIKSYKLVKNFEYKKAGLPAGTAVSPILAPDVYRNGGSRFSTLQTTQNFYTTLKKKCQVDILSYSKVKLSLEDIHLEHPADPAHGDYASNVALTLAKEIKKPPMEIAQKIARVLPQKDFLEKVEVAPPGFINPFLSPKFLINQVYQVLKESAKYGSSRVGKGKTVVIDYSSPNIAKPFSVGHLRSTIIGQALYNLYKFLGYKVIGDNHIGDWGTQFGQLIYAIKEWSEPSKLPSMTVQDLVNLYVRFHEEAAKDPLLKEKGRLWFKRLEEGEKETQEIWGKCVEISWKEFNRIYNLLDTHIDFAFGESFYKDMMPAVVEEAKKLGIAKESEGALVIEVDNGMPPVLLLKSDGATTYHTRDLATIKFRQEKFGPVDEMIYETGVDHVLHFRQLFAATRKFNWGKRVKYTHVAHGMMRLPTGRMRTRKGEIVLLEEILAEAVERARKIVEETNRDFSEENKDKVAKVVGIGAVKYNDLSQHYSKDIVFDWRKMLNLQGNSAPYLLYTYARAKSVLRRAGDKNVVAQFTCLPVGRLRTFWRRELKIATTEEEMAILRTIYKFPEVVREAAEMHAPNLICNFLFDFAQKFNLFYEKLPIIKAPGEKQKELRLALTGAVAQVVKNGLDLLGIKILERM